MKPKPKPKAKKGKITRPAPKPVMKPAANKRQIMIVDDHSLVRLGLNRLIHGEDDLCVCAEAANAAQAMEVLTRTKPDLIILDLLMKGSGLELIKNIHARYPSLLILIVSMRDEAHYAERVLAAGAKGYVMKRDAAEKVVQAIRQILDGGVYLSDAMTTRFLHRIVGKQPSTNDTEPTANLSDRELEVFELLGQGRKTEAIALELRISIKTVQTYRANIMVKLGLDGAAELVHRAFEWVQKEDGGE